MSQLSREERLDILERALAADALGDYETAQRVRKELPLAPHLAQAAKEMWGKNYLLSSGFDLSEAEAKYGKGWLER